MTNLAQVKGSFLDFGEVHYIVDSDYRTQAQGWTRADRTGPLDLYLARSGNALGSYVFRTADYTNDRECVQAAINAAIDFRQDALLFTPGTYTIGTTALSVDVADLRILGPRCSSPVRAAVTLTDSLGTHDITGAADRLEVAYLRFVPLTAQYWWQVATTSDFHHWHDFFYDSNGIAADTGTGLAIIDGTWDNTVVENFVMHTDAAQGPLFRIDGNFENLVIRNFTHYVLASMAVSLATLNGGTSRGLLVQNGRGYGLASAQIVSHLLDITVQLMTAGGVGFVENFIGQSGYAATATLVTTASNEFGIVNCGLAPADGSANPVFNGNATAITASWAAMYPYTS